MHVLNLEKHIHIHLNSEMKKTPKSSPDPGSKVECMILLCENDFMFNLFAARFSNILWNLTVSTIKVHVYPSDARKVQKPGGSVTWLNLKVKQVDGTGSVFFFCRPRLSLTDKASSAVSAGRLPF